MAERKEHQHLIKGHMKIDSRLSQVTVSLIFLLFVLACSQILLMWKKLAWTETQVIAHTDSLQLARDYAVLVTQVTDLQQELGARSTGQIPVLFMHSPTSPGTPPGIRPVLRATETHFQDDQSQASKALSRVSLDPTRKSIEVYLEQQDATLKGVDTALQSLGFQMTKKSPLADSPTNAVTFGDSVPLRDIRTITFALMRAGIGVARLRRSATEGADLPRKVVIEHVPYAVDWPPLTFEQVERLTGSPP